MAEVFHACGCSNAHECRCYLRAGKGCGTCRPCLANIATLDATGVAGKRICALSIAPRDFIQVPPAGVKLEFKLSALREAGLGLGPLDPRFPYLLVKQFRVVVEDIHQSAAELLASQEARLAELCRETMSLHDKPPAGESDNPDLRWTNSAVVHGAMQRVQVSALMDILARLTPPIIADLMNISGRLSAARASLLRCGLRTLLQIHREKVLKHSALEGRRLVLWGKAATMIQIAWHRHCARLRMWEAKQSRLAGVIQKWYLHGVRRFALQRALIARRVRKVHRAARRIQKAFRWYMELLERRQREFELSPEGIKRREMIRRNKAAIEIQRVARGLLGRLEFRRRKNPRYLSNRRVRELADKFFRVGDMWGMLQAINEDYERMRKEKDGDRNNAKAFVDLLVSKREDAEAEDWVKWESAKASVLPMSRQRPPSRGVPSRASRRRSSSRSQSPSGLGTSLHGVSTSLSAIELNYVETRSLSRPGSQATSRTSNFELTGTVRASTSHSQRRRKNNPLLSSLPSGSLSGMLASDEALSRTRPLSSSRVDKSRPQTSKSETGGLSTSLARIDESARLTTPLRPTTSSFGSTGGSASLPKWTPMNDTVSDEEDAEYSPMDQMERESLLERFGLKSPSANFLLTDVPGMHGTVSMLLFHAALRLVDIPDGVGGTEGIKASRSRPPEYIGRIQLPHDYGRTGAGEAAAELYTALPPSLLKAQWEQRALTLAQPATDLLHRLGCTTVNDVAKINLDRIGVDPLLASSVRRLIAILSAADHYARAVLVRRNYIGGLPPTVKANPNRPYSLTDKLIKSPLQSPVVPTHTMSEVPARRHVAKSLLDPSIDVDDYLESVGKVGGSPFTVANTAGPAPPPLFTLGAPINPMYTPLLGHSDGFCVLDACAFSSQGQRQGVHGVGKEATVQEEIAVFERVVVDALDTECTSMDDHVSVLLIRSIMVLPLPSHILLDIADHAAGVSRAPGTDDRWKILIPFEGFARVLCNHTPGDRKFEAITLDRLKVAMAVADVWLPALMSDRFTTVARVLRATKASLETALARAYPVANFMKPRTVEQRWLYLMASLVHPSVLAQQIRFVADSWMHRCPRVAVMLSLHKEVTTVDFRYGRGPDDPSSRVDPRSLPKKPLVLVDRGRPQDRRRVGVTSPVRVPRRTRPGDKKKGEDSETMVAHEQGPSASVEEIQAALPAWLVQEDDNTDLLQRLREDDSVGRLAACGHRCAFPGCRATFKTMRTLQAHEKLHTVQSQLAQGTQRRKVTV